MKKIKEMRLLDTVRVEYSAQHTHRKQKNMDRDNFIRSKRNIYVEKNRK